MTVRVGINGFGRIGRDFLRCVLAQETSQVEVVAINDITDTATLANLLQYDSTYGPLRERVGHTAGTISIGAKTLRVTAEREPAALDWKSVGVDIVIESTGRFRTREAAAAHLDAGARKVILSSPGKGVDATLVLGVNEETYDPARHHIISNASCTTNCVAPMVSVLHGAFGIEHALMTTIHSYTNDQVILDSPHKDLRRGRSGAVNLIPTSTGAAKAVGQVIPAMAGKIDGVAVRVPVVDGSLTDLVVELSEPATAEQVNRAFADAASGYLKGLLRYNEDPIVSRDIIGDPSSCIFDAPLTQANGNIVKVFGWYDNEWGYTSRLLDLTELVAEALNSPDGGAS
ncbi:type I glyceraldehyde-3-phosphate dehydrogenase [Kribbella qitaiheensis]|uniref:Type I glyceraldehyde-3-phosphate dehydrogenase n=1 Tax=Kribbella qitaiheensis TaxID=1544730 RepID=A0A7G6WSK1_9ACTN|nr:type I glyceraldehyde-3-phosphate dehydrogenase [Kribbella qitaiheensis]QNE16966.1 type I glyceraldehyde-3-phosphate dehydrogenase [Kribbella qitaiheensis]